MWKFIILIAVVFICFKFNLLLGIAASVAYLAYLIFSALPNLYAIRGNKEYQDKQSVDMGLFWYEKAYKTGRAGLNLKNSYAMLLARAGRFEGAETVLNEIILDRRIKKEKKLPAKQYRALVYFKLGKTEDALEEASELFENYKNTIMYGLMGYFKHATNQPAEDALKFCIEAYDFNADDRDISDNLVLAYYRVGEYEKAETLVAELIEKNPQFVEAYYHAALVAKALGKRKEAADYLKKIDECRRTALTTVSEDEVEALKKRL